MHASSLENMQKCHDRYVNGTFIESRDTLDVVEIGAADVNGGYRGIFANEKIRYLGVDLAAGPGVDIVLESPYSLPLEDGSADVVLSGQMLEHCEFFWLAFGEMLRILKPDGLLFLIAPSAGPIHQYPVDCYRFYPDAYRALAKLHRCQVVDVWRDDRGPWKDLVGIFSKSEKAQWTPHDDAYEAFSASTLPHIPNYPNIPEIDLVKGEVSYIDFLKTVHRILEPGLYLEIGIRHGSSLALAKCEAIGIDPCPEIKQKLGSNVSIFRRASDDFFEFDAESAIGKRTVDLSFIDGMHLFENALKDFINVERHSSPNSVIFVDDIYPNHPVQAERERKSRVWTGDVWKIVPCLKKFRPDLKMFALNTSPTGSLLIAGLNPANRVLVEQYNPLMRIFSGKDYLSPPEYILNRENAVDVAHDSVTSLLKTLRGRRENSAARQQ